MGKEKRRAAAKWYTKGWAYLYSLQNTNRCRCLFCLYRNPVKSAGQMVTVLVYKQGEKVENKRNNSKNGNEQQAETG